MSITTKYHIEPIDRSFYYKWLTKKHYAKRIPIVLYAFGLFDDEKKINGVCTFGPPNAKQYNNCNFIFSEIRILLLELNRLVVNDGLPKNCLSFFVSQCLKQLPECCIISYADNGYGHHGYIYQATNWLYTGAVKAHEKRYFILGKEVHARSLTSKIDLKSIKDNKNVEIKNTSIKHRYFYFNTDKKTKSNMKKQFLLNILPYPKGDNTKYDTGTPIIQVKTNLFDL